MRLNRWHVEARAITFDMELYVRNDGDGSRYKLGPVGHTYHTVGDCLWASPWGMPCATLQEAWAFMNGITFVKEKVDESMVPVSR